MVRTAFAIEREVDDTRSIWDMGASAKRKENQSSSSSRKKQKTSALYRSQGQGRGHQGQGQGQSFKGGKNFNAPSQSGQMKCYHCHQLGQKRRNCPRRQGSQSYETPQSQALAGHALTRFVPHYPNMGQGNQCQSQGSDQGRGQDF